MTVTGANNTSSVVYSNSAARLYHEFYSNLSAAINAPDSSCGFLLLTPTKKSGDNILSAILGESRRQSFQMSGFSTTKKLCKEITAELLPEQTIISGTSCKEILKEIVVGDGDESHVFSAIQSCPGLYDDLYCVISKLKECGFDPKSPAAGFQSVAADSFLRIFQRYNDYMRQKSFFDEADVMTFAKENLSRSKRIKKAQSLFIIGFTDFSSFEEEFILTLLNHSSAAKIFMLYDDSPEMRERYAHLTRFMAKLQNLPGLQPVFLPDDDSGVTNLSYIQKNLFISLRENKNALESDSSVKIVKARNFDEEVGYCAAKIHAFLDSGEYSCEDIAIVTRDKKKHADTINKALSNYQVDTDLDQVTPLASLNIVKTLLLPFLLVQRDFLRGDFISFLGSGYVDISSDVDIAKAEIALMEACVIFGAKNYTPKLKTYKPLWGGSREPYIQLGDFFEAAIGAITSKIHKNDRVKNYKVALLSVVDKSYKMKERIVSNLKNIPPELIKRDIDAYTSFFTAFDEIITAFELSGKATQEVSLATMIDLLTIQLATRTVPTVKMRSATATKRGELKVYAPEEFFTQTHKVVFALNMTDGTFPKNITPSFLLGGAHEKLTFLPTTESELKSERLYFYKVISLCDERLYLTYSESGADGSSHAARSAFIDELSLLLGEAVELSAELSSIEQKASRDKLLMEFFSSITSNPTDEMKEIFNHVVESPDNPELFKRVLTNALIEHERESSDFFTQYGGNIFRDTPKTPATVLQGELREKIERRAFSASQIDMFAGCPIMYFFNYIMKLSKFEPPEITLPSRIRGTIMHDILFAYHTALKAESPVYSDVSDELVAASERFRKIAAEYFTTNPEVFAATNPHIMEIEKESITNVLHEVVTRDITERYKALDNLRKKTGAYEKALASSEKNRMKGIIPQSLTKAEVAYNKARENSYLFEPAYFEYGFGVAKGKPGAEFSPELFELKLGDSDDSPRISLRGFIDRIDIDEELGRFIVLDYKTGQYPSDNAVKRGLSLQLPMYAEAVRQTLLTDMTPSPSIYYDIKNIKRTNIVAQFDAVRPFLKKYIEMMKRGEFYAEPNDKCKSWCAFSSICRYVE